ncbi:MAG: hypothetical protein ACOYLT_11395, partial [Flavobacterium sp.]|uniref:hypothetical protein n=1 Tax=Flavobacterium sp. TaxID=239 RepID=UPI003BDF2103
MKKKEVVRLYNFSDAKLVLIGNEKIAFMRRDKTEFDKFNIKTPDVNLLETQITAFENTETDVEAVADQTDATAVKTKLADNLREAIRNVMARAALKFGEKSAKYRKFGTDALARQTDSDLFITAKRVVRVANIFFADLATKGLTAGMLTEITTLGDEFIDLVVDVRVEVSARDIKQEDRVEAGNAIYAVL